MTVKQRSGRAVRGPARPTTCHTCGAEVLPDPDPRREGWLTCAACGPVYMPFQGRWIRIHIACSLEEAGRRVAQLEYRLWRAAQDLAT